MNGSRQIDELARELEAATESARAVAQGLSLAELARRPDPRSWSVAECIEHLNLTTRAYRPILGEAFATLERSAERVDRRYRIDWMGRFMRWSVEPPPRFKVKTTRPFVPVAIADASRVLDDFVLLQREARGWLERGRGLALDRHKVRSPFDRRIRYNVFACLALLAAHQRRHLWQAGRARERVVVA